MDEVICPAAEKKKTAAGQIDYPCFHGGELSVGRGNCGLLTLVWKVPHSGQCAGMYRKILSDRREKKCGISGIPDERKEVRDMAEWVLKKTDDNCLAADLWIDNDAGY